MPGSSTICVPPGPPLVYRRTKYSGHPRVRSSALGTIAFQLARIALTVGDNRRIRGADLWDAIHYADAVYADLMVTDDKGFRETCAAVPRCPFDIETFEEFVTERLGVH